MGLPLRQSVAVGSYLMKQKLQGREKFPLVLMLEPLYRCNLACAGCGKIQHPEPILNQNLTPQECWDAAEECGAPVVSIAGGEPLIHPQIGEIVAGLVKQKRFVYLCTNAILLERSLKKFQPSPYLTIDVHVDGLQEVHDESVQRKGVFDLAVRSIKGAKAGGFRVATNTTVFDTTPTQDIVDLFDFLTDLGIDAMLVSPGYSYEKAPQQDIFLKRQKTMEFFQTVLQHPHRKRWPFSNTPVYLDFLQGKTQLQCTPWGNPCRSVLGWQKPCYLMTPDGYTESFQELMEETEWDRYGYGRDSRCENCMVHSGYEASAVLALMSDAKLMMHSLQWSLTSA